MDLSTDWTAETVRSNGVDLRAYHVGDPTNPPLVVLHGFYENARCRIRLASDLADDYHVVLYDARAHGRSAAPDDGYGIDDRVADLVGLCDTLDLDDPILVGHSMGGSTAAWAAADHPDFPHALVLEDPAGMRPEPADLGPDDRAELVREKLADLDDRTTADLRGEYDDPESEHARRQAVADSQLRPQIADIARAGYPHLADAFPHITCPTLVLRRDQATDERITDHGMVDALDRGRLVHVPDAGHHVFEEQYDAARAELRVFLRRHGN